MKKGLLLFIFSLAAWSAVCSPFTKTFYIDGKYVVQKVTVEEVEEYNEKGLLVTDTITARLRKMEKHLLNQIMMKKATCCTQ